MILDMYGNNAQEVTPYERVAAALNGEKNRSCACELLSQMGCTGVFRSYF